MKHLHVLGLITLAWGQKPPQLLATLILRRSALSRFKILRPALRCNGRCEIGELLRLKRKDLVAGLRRLQSAACALARCYVRRRLGAVGIEVADNAGLNAQGVLQRGDRVLPTRLRVGDECLIGLAARRRRIIGRERAVDLLYIIGNALCLSEQLLGTLDRRLKLL